MQACKENIKLPFRREKNQGPKRLGGVPRTIQLGWECRSHFCDSRKQSGSRNVSLSCWASKQSVLVGVHPLAPCCWGTCPYHSKLFPLCGLVSFLQDRREGTHHAGYDCNLPKAFYLKKWDFFSVLKFLITIVISFVVSHALHFSPFKPA